MRDAVRNKERWKGAVRLPKILVLTERAGEHVHYQQADRGVHARAEIPGRGQASSSEQRQRHGAARGCACCGGKWAV